MFNAVRFLTNSLLLKSSMLIAVDESPTIYCWTNCPVTSPCCTAGSHRLGAPNEDTAAEDVLAHLAVENGL